MTRLCIVAPCFNEEELVERFHDALTAVLDRLDAVSSRIVYVDDGSTDGTLTRLNRIALRDPRVLVYALSRNFGHQIALSAGLDVAEGDVIVMMDSDLQHPAQVIPKLLDAWRAGYDVVQAVRHDTADASFFKRATAGGFYWLFNKLSDMPIVPGACDFCLLSRAAHDALRSMPERHRFLRGMVVWIGFPRTQVPFDAPPRQAGESKYTPVKMVGLAVAALMSFSAAPMRLAMRLGWMLIVCGAAYLAYVVFRYFYVDDLVRGWGSVIATVIILGGTQLLFFGLIGEYVARVFEESKHRPLYVFKQKAETPWNGLDKSADERERSHAL